MNDIHEIETKKDKVYDENKVKYETNFNDQS